MEKLYMSFFRLKQNLKYAPDKKTKTRIKIWFYFNHKKYKHYNTLLEQGYSCRSAFEKVLNNK